MACGYTTHYFSSILHPVIPVIVKLDNLGRVLWVKEYTSFTGNGFTSLPGGRFEQIIKTPNGYAACGSTNSSSGGKMVIAEVDEDGNDINNTYNMFDLNGITNIGCGATTFALDPTNSYFIIAGNTAYSGIGINADLSLSLNQPLRKIHVSKISYANPRSTTASALFGSTWGNPAYSYRDDILHPVYGGNGVAKLLVKDNGGGAYDIYICGHKSMRGDNNLISAVDFSETDKLTEGGDPGDLYQHDKDIWLLKLNSSLAQQAEYTYNKSDLSSIIHTDIGPCSARGVTSPNNVGYYSPIVSNYLNSSVNDDERGNDMVITQDGKIVIAALVNRMSPTNGPTGALQGNAPVATGSSDLYKGFPGAPGIPAKRGIWDVGNGRNFVFDDHLDGDGYLIKIEPSDGSIIWDKNVNHFSSRDFHMQVIQKCDGNYIVAGSTADYYTGLDEYEALLMETPDNSSDNFWQRHTRAKDKEPNVCIFALAKTNDDGFIIAGDADIGQTFSISKFSQTDPLKFKRNHDYTFEEPYTLPSDETWNSGINKSSATKIIVSSGKTLTIDGIAVRFASSHELWDYWELPGAPNANPDAGKTGIFVEPGGHLILQNDAVIEGVNTCNGGEQMWDGIAVIGDPAYNNHGGTLQNMSHEGLLEMTDATIKNARYGIEVGDFNQLYSTGNSSYVDGGGGQWQGTRSGWSNPEDASKGGGKIILNNSLIQDCRFGIKFQHFYNYNSSSITGCTFETTSGGMRDHCTYPNRYDGGSLPANTHVSFDDVHYINLVDNTFTCNSGFSKNIRPFGIAFWNAGLNLGRSCTHVDLTSGDCDGTPGAGNVFTNLQAGIIGDNGPASSKYMVIDYSTFDNDNVGISIANSYNNLTMTHNLIKVPESFDFLPQGVRLTTCTGYKLAGNSFDHCTGCSGTPVTNVGVNVGWGSTYDNNVNKINLNTFDNLRVASLGLGYNSDQSGTRGLEFHCNDYNSGNTYDIVRVSQFFYGGTTTVANATLKKDQGNCTGGSSSPAGNRFYNDCNGGGYERLWADLYTTQAVTYHANASSSDYDPNSSCTQTEYSLNYCFSVPPDHSDACPPLNNKWNSPDAATELTDQIAQLDESLGKMTPEDEGYNATLTERDLTANELVRNYDVNGNSEDAGQLLGNYGRYDEAIAFFLQAGDTTSAITAWGNLTDTTTADSLYKQLLWGAIYLQEHELDWKDLDSATLAGIDTLAKIPSREGFLAASISAHVHGTSFEFPEPVIEDAPARPGNNHGTSQYAGLPSVKTINAASEAFKLYPNPNNGSFSINTDKGGDLKICTIEGRELCSYRINTGTVKLSLPTALVPGIYIGRFVADDGNQKVMQLIYQP